jgi:hypothetical protein
VALDCVKVVVIENEGEDDLGEFRYFDAMSYKSMSTPMGQWSEPRSCGQINACFTRFIAAGEAST